MKTPEEVEDDIKWLMSLVEDGNVCTECDIFDKCQEENRNYCEKEQTDADIHSERNQA